MPFVIYDEPLYITQTIPAGTGYAMYVDSNVSDFDAFWSNFPSDVAGLILNISSNTNVTSSRAGIVGQDFRIQIARLWNYNDYWYSPDIYERHVRMVPCQFDADPFGQKRFEMDTYANGYNWNAYDTAIVFEVFGHWTFDSGYLPYNANLNITLTPADRGDITSKILGTTWYANLVDVNAITGFSFRMNISSTTSQAVVVWNPDRGHPDETFGDALDLATDAESYWGLRKGDHFIMPYKHGDRIFYWPDTGTANTQLYLGIAFTGPKIQGRDFASSYIYDVPDNVTNTPPKVIDMTSMNTGLPVDTMDGACMLNNYSRTDTGYSSSTPFYSLMANGSTDFPIYEASRYVGYRDYIYGTFNYYNRHHSQSFYGPVKNTMYHYVKNMSTLNPGISPVYKYAYYSVISNPTEIIATCSVFSEVNKTDNDVSVYTVNSKNAQNFECWFGMENMNDNHSSVMGINFRYQDANNYYGFVYNGHTFQGNSNKGYYLFKVIGGVYSTISYVAADITDSAKRTFKVYAYQDVIQVDVDFVNIIDTTDSAIEFSGGIGLYSYASLT